MPRLNLVRWEIDRTSSGRMRGTQRCPRCRVDGLWAVVQERRRLQLLGTGVGRWSTSDQVDCRACGCSLPAGWRAAQDEPSPAPVPA
jgi:hypothetical protein